MVRIPALLPDSFFRGFVADHPILATIFLAWGVVMLGFAVWLVVST